MNPISQIKTLLYTIAAVVFLATAAAALYYHGKAEDERQNTAAARAKVAAASAALGEAERRAQIAEGIGRVLSEQLEVERARTESARAELAAAVDGNPAWARQALPPEIKGALKK